MLDLARSLLLRPALALPLASLLCFSTSGLAKEPPALRSSSANALSCGESKVLIQTTCSASSNGTPPHCRQKLTFTNTDARDGLAINYIPQPVKSRDEPFINQINCSSVQGAFYVVARSSNFGNCSICEWMDVYTTRGRLMGSTHSVVRSLRLPRKQLPKNLERLLEGSQKMQSISIDRSISTQ